MASSDFPENEVWSTDSRGRENQEEEGVPGRELFRDPGPVTGARRTKWDEGTMDSGHFLGGRT